MSKAILQKKLSCHWLALWCVKLRSRTMIFIAPSGGCFREGKKKAKSTQEKKINPFNSQMNSLMHQKACIISINDRTILLLFCLWHHFTFSSVTFKRIKLQSSAWSRSKGNFSEIIFHFWKKWIRLILYKLRWGFLFAAIIIS